VEIAHAIATNPQWADVQDAAVFVRHGTRPLMGVIGRFSVVDEHRIAALRHQIAEPLPCHISYRRAEEDCELLAERLVDAFGLSELRTFHFTAIPRGGYIVLGMLAYRLGLRRSQLEAPHPLDVPTVVVDDCSITGLRFGEWLRKSECSSVIFAHLYSHPDLRAAVVAREERVQACVSAGDLTDRAPERLGAGYDAWREDRLRRSEGRYWVGQIERIAFAWSEPEQAFWNAATRRREKSWSLIPPRLHSRNRKGVGIPAIPVQVQKEPVGEFHPAPSILWGEVDGDVVVGDVDSELSFTLSGVAADMWRKVLGVATADAALAALLEDYDVDAATLKTDLQHFIREMCSRGAWEERSDALRLVG
jgi:hypothetical protein